MEDDKTVKPAKVSLRETWEQMEALIDQGIAKSIGVSNCQGQTLYDLMTYARHPISNLQIEHHPYLVQPGLINLAQTHGIAITAYSSFGPQSFLELPADFRDRPSKVELLFDAQPIKSIAEKHGKTPAQVLLRWATQRYVWNKTYILGVWVADRHNRNIAVIPKSNNQSRLAQNLDVTSFNLSKEEIDSISKLDQGLRFNDPGHYLPNHPLHIFA